MHVRTKICGITNEYDAQLAVEMGADAIGLNFYAKSLRYVDPHKAFAFTRNIPLFVEVIPLFANVTHHEAKEGFPSRFTQIHADRHEIISQHDGGRWIVAFPVKDATSLYVIDAYLELLESSGGSDPAAILVDASVPGQYGGTGQTAPWQLLADFKPGIPLILAGGLTPDNVAEAIRIVRPYAVDVASGVESSPGQKDAGKMRRFIEAVHRACRD